MPNRVFLPPNCIAVRNKFLGGRGVGVYLSPLDGEAKDIVFRRHRPYRERSRGTSVGVPMIFSGDYTPALAELLNDATIATDKLVDGETDGEFDVTLPAGYEAEVASFWLQVRTHEAGLENTTLYRPRQITVGDGVLAEPVLGTANLLRVVKLDGGAAEVDFEYLPSLSGSSPESFVLRQLTGIDVIDDVLVSYVVDQRDYSATINGMTSGETYTFELLGVVGATETLLIATITVIADADGPSALTVTYEEET